MWSHDVYICGSVAERENADLLAGSIRAYKIPRKTELPNPSADYHRVLVDTEELPLDDERRALIDGCRFFIILCSPVSRASVPVMERFSYFEEKHGKTNVIAVLCEGEPAEAFPPTFIEEKAVRHMLPDGSIEERVETIEPVASDLRGESRRETKRLLRYETVRIVATLMGIAPDTLERRHNRRLRQRVTAIVSVLGVILIATGSLFTYFGMQAEREGQIAERQASQSQAAAKRIIEDVPAMFPNDPEALSFVKEGILDTLVMLGDDSNALRELIDLDSELTVLPGDSLKAALQKAALRRVLNVGDIDKTYLAAAERLGPACDNELFMNVMYNFKTIPSGSGHKYVFFVTKNSGALQQGDLILGLDGQSFSYTDRWIFKTDSGDTDLTGALSAAIKDEVITLQILRYSDGALTEYETTLTADELSSCEALGV